MAMAFRADSIVADAELIRDCLSGDLDSAPARWSLLGQSFGGFCAVQYLSVAPKGQPHTQVISRMHPEPFYILSLGQL